MQVQRVSKYYTSRGLLGNTALSMTGKFLVIEEMARFNTSLCCPV